MWANGPENTTNTFTEFREKNRFSASLKYSRFLWLKNDMIRTVSATVIALLRLVALMKCYSSINWIKCIYNMFPQMRICIAHRLTSIIE